ncbi:MAG: DUF4250 domain-containing protein [Clostridiaceae bacterium]|nr:DUF4250 domain-containing protein [Clostridiaceae bacterium]
MDIPRDPFILLSYINTKLRDFYPTLDNLCEDMNQDKQQLVTTLAGIGYSYDPKINQFL